MLVQIVDKTASLSKCQKFALVANVMNRTHKHGLKNNVIKDYDYVKKIPKRCSEEKN